MRLIVLSIAGSLALCAAAVAQTSQPAGDRNAAGMQSGQSGAQTGERQGGAKAGTRVQHRTTVDTRTRAGDVNVNVRARSGPDTIVQRRSRRHVTVVDDPRPSVTVVKKKKRVVKRKRPNVVAVTPERRTTVVRQRRGAVVAGGTVGTRTTIRSGVRQQTSGEVNIRSRSQTRTKVNRGETTGSGTQIQGRGTVQGGGKVRGGAQTRTEQ